MLAAAGAGSLLPSWGFAQFSIASDNSQWKVGFSGPGNDYVADQQTGQGDADFVGGRFTNSAGLTLDYPSLYWYYDPGSSTTDGTLYFRFRVNGKDNTTNWTTNSVYYLGMDFAAPGFGKMDMFLILDLTNNGKQIFISGAGNNLNTSPSTTSVNSTKYSTVPINSTNYNFSYADQVDLRLGALHDLGGTVNANGTPAGNGAIDGFVSFGISFSSVVSAAGLNVNGLPGLTIDNTTPVQWGMATSTQTNALNQDINGVNQKASNYNSITWDQVYVEQGIPSTGISPIRSTWRVASAGAISTPVNLGNIRTNTPFATAALSLTNNADADGFSEKLDASIAAGSGSLASGSVSLLDPGATSTALQVGLATPTVAGPRSGSATVTLTSNGAGTSNAGLTPLGTQNLAITGAAYDFANPSYSTTPVNFGNVRVGATQQVAFSNPAITLAAYQDDLAVNVASGLPATVSANSISQVAANGASQPLTFTVTEAGSLAGTANLNLVSNPLLGTGLVGRTTTDQIALSGAAYRYATGTLDTTAINYGYVHAGAYGGSLTTGVSITNTAAADGYSDALGLGLSGTIAGISYSAAGTDLAGGVGSQAGAVTLDTTTPRVINQSLTASLTSVPVAAGLSGAAVGSGSVAISAVVYSGLSTWTSPTGGNWNNFGRWEVSGGAPGTDATFTTTDTATFGSAIGSAPATVAVNVPVSVKSVTFDNAAAAYTVAGPGTLTLAGAGATLSSLAGSHTIAAPVALANAAAVSVSGAGEVLTVSGGISGDAGIEKSGEGTLRLEGANSFAGGVSIAQGSLNVAGTMAGGVSVAAGGTLLGGGVVGGSLSVAEAGIVAPGERHSTGTLSVGGNSSTWAGGGVYSWNLLSTSGPGDQNALIGSGFDHLGLEGSLHVSATVDDPFVIDLVSLSQQGVTGAMAAWDAQQPYRWTILTALGGITGASATAFRVDSADFMALNSGGWTHGTFSVAPSLDGMSLDLVYSIPEPSLMGAMGAAAGFLLTARPRRRRN